MADFLPLSGKAALAVQYATARGNLWEGAVRSSKTIGSILAWVKFIRSGPVGELCMIGRTERTLRRNVIDPMVAMFGSRAVRYLAGAGELSVLGRRVYVSGANNVLAAEKIQGMTLAGFYGDEMSTWPEAVFSIARTRLSVDGAQWFGTTNPGPPNHFLKRDVIDRAKLRIARDGSVVVDPDEDAFDAHVFSFTIEDNPFLPPGYVGSLKREYHGMFYRRFILGEWCLAEGVVWDAWDEDTHILSPGAIPPIEQFLSVGIDYGTRNPLHAVLVGIGQAPPGMPGKALYAVREWVWDSRETRRQLTDPEYSQRVRGWLGSDMPEYACVDPSAASFRVQLFRDGFPTVAADNGVSDGVRSVGALLAAKRLYVSSACPRLIAEIPGYCWDDKAAARGEDAVVKVDDHGPDALRYAIRTTETVWHDLIYS
jgi:PBSX family phage terminase large subunit